MPLTEQVVVHDPVASGGRGGFHIKPGGKRMKWMIASDIHGSAYYCRKLLEAYEKEEAERLLLLGISYITVPAMTSRKDMHRRKSLNF